MTSEARRQRLLELLRQLELVLRTGDHERWADVVRKAATEVDRRDAHGLRRFLGAFHNDGLGDVWPLDSARDRLQSEAYELASQLCREHDSAHDPDERASNG